MCSYTNHEIYAGTSIHCHEDPLQPTLVPGGTVRNPEKPFDKEHKDVASIITSEKLRSPWVSAAYTKWAQHTKGGNTFSAARRGTEKPPCVLVSLAVKVLQK